MSGSIVSYDKYVSAHEINEKIEIFHRTNAWIKSARVFRKNSKRKRQNDARYLLLMS